MESIRMNTYEILRQWSTTKFYWIFDSEMEPIQSYGANPVKLFTAVIYGFL
jgi:hypothetical protein